MSLHTIVRLLAYPVTYYLWRVDMLDMLKSFRPGDDARTMAMAARVILENAEHSADALLPLLRLICWTPDLEAKHHHYLQQRDDLRDVLARFQDGSAARSELAVAFWHFTVTQMWATSEITRRLRRAVRIRHATADPALRAHSQSVTFASERLYAAMMGQIDPDTMFEAARWNVLRSHDIVSRKYALVHAFHLHNADHVSDESLEVPSLAADRDPSGRGSGTP